MTAKLDRFHAAWNAPRREKPHRIKETGLPGQPRPRLRPPGGVIVAPTASELILSLTIAVTNNLTVTQLAQSMAVYPSLSGSITEAARRLITHSDLD